MDKPTPDIPVTVTPDGRKNLPMPIENNVLRILVTYLLFERGEETQLKIAFAALVQERHNKEHMGEKDAPAEFQDCQNEVCRGACAILENQRDQSVELTAFMIELMQKFGVSYTPGNGKIVARLMKRGERPRVEIAQSIPTLSVRGK